MSEIPMLTKEQAAIIGAYTGFAAGSFGDVHEYAQRKLGRSIWSHEFGSGGVAEELHKAATDDFLALCYRELERGGMR